MASSIAFSTQAPDGNRVPLAPGQGTSTEVSTRLPPAIDIVVVVVVVVVVCETDSFALPVSDKFD